MDEFFTVIAWMGLVLSVLLSAARYCLYLKYDEVIGRIAPVEIEYMKSLDDNFPTKESSLSDSKKFLVYAFVFAAMLGYRYWFL